ncbi:hypothetical protein [Paenibacillus sp. KN14-4R]|uniref:hypothetical protein n=1 Tax=Paenibacillus sp. KN14-4R TaxID=3445773 RepID=UPI003FA14024
MMKNQNLRDLIYVSCSDLNSKCFYSYGIEFYEFMSCVHNKPENLILLKHNFDNAQWNPHTRFDYVTSKEISELIEDNVYGYGDFCWVDYNNEEDLDKLTKFQIAELLFFSHLAKPLREIPMIRFAYYAHDDGWFNKLYVSLLEDYKVILSRTITLKLHKLTKRSFVEMPNNIAKVLLESALEGLLIDLSKITKSKTDIKIPIAAVGHYTDMDKVYNFKEEITEYKVWLVYSKKTWKFFREG